MRGPVEKPALALCLHGTSTCVHHLTGCWSMRAVQNALSCPHQRPLASFDAAETWACPTLYTLPRFFKSAPEVANSSGAQL